MRDIDTNFKMSRAEEIFNEKQPTKLKHSITNQVQILKDKVGNIGTYSKIRSEI